MIKFNVLDWLTGEIKFTADIDCGDDAPNEIKLGLALKWGVANKADFYRARLDRARLDGARLVGARLDGASLVGASLDGASLDGASLDGASLDGASLDGASLVGASLDGASLDGASLDALALTALALTALALTALACGRSVQTSSTSFSVRKPKFQRFWKRSAPGISTAQHTAANAPVSAARSRMPAMSIATHSTSWMPHGQPSAGFSVSNPVTLRKPIRSPGSPRNGSSNSWGSPVSVRAL